MAGKGAPKSECAGADARRSPPGSRVLRLVRMSARLRPRVVCRTHVKPVHTSASALNTEARAVARHFMWMPGGE